MTCSCRGCGSGSPPRDVRAGVADLQPGPPRGLGGDGRGRLHALARLEVRRGSHLTTPIHTIVPLTEEARVVVRMLAAGREADALADGRPVGEHRALLGRWGLLEPGGPGVP